MRRTPILRLAVPRREGLARTARRSTRSPHNGQWNAQSMRSSPARAPCHLPPPDSSLKTECSARPSLHPGPSSSAHSLAGQLIGHRPHHRPRAPPHRSQRFSGWQTTANRLHLASLPLAAPNPHVRRRLDPPWRAPRRNCRWRRPRLRSSPPEVNSGQARTPRVPPLRRVPPRPRSRPTPPPQRRRWRFSPQSRRREATQPSAHRRPAWETPPPTFRTSPAPSPTLRLPPRRTLQTCRSPLLHSWQRSPRTEATNRLATITPSPHRLALHFRPRPRPQPLSSVFPMRRPRGAVHFLPARPRRQPPARRRRQRLTPLGRQFRFSRRRQRNRLQFLHRSQVQPPTLSPTCHWRLRAPSANPPTSSPAELQPMEPYERHEHQLQRQPTASIGPHQPLRT